MTELHYLIPPEWRTLPLNRVLRQGLGFSALGLKSVRERGCVRLDGLVSPLYQTPGSAERLSIVLPEDPPSEIEPVTGRLHLLYEDTHLLIVDKPAGMAVHPGPGHHGDTLGNLLMGHYAQEGEQHLFRPVNRLDRSTSGLMCVAKHAYAAERLGSLTAEGRMKKEYLAICEASPLPALRTDRRPDRSKRRLRTGAGSPTGWKGGGHELQSHCRLSRPQSRTTRAGDRAHPSDPGAYGAYRPPFDRRFSLRNGGPCTDRTGCAPRLYPEIPAPHHRSSALF